MSQYGSMSTVEMIIVKDSVRVGKLTWNNNMLSVLLVNTSNKYRCPQNEEHFNCGTNPPLICINLYTSVYFFVHETLRFQNTLSNNTFSSLTIECTHATHIPSNLNLQTS